MEKAGLKYERKIANKVDDWFSERGPLPGIIERGITYNGKADVDIYIRYKNIESFIEVKSTSSEIRVITENDELGFPLALKGFEPKFKRVESKAKNLLAKERSNLDLSKKINAEIRNYKKKEPDHIGFLTRGMLADKNSKPRQVIRCRIGYTPITFVQGSKLGKLLSDIIRIRAFCKRKIERKYFDKPSFKLEDIIENEVTLTKD